MGERKIVVIPANPEKVKLYKVGIYCRVSFFRRSAVAQEVNDFIFQSYDVLS